MFDGLAIKSKIHRYYPERIKEELYYIAKKVKNMDELIITDLNFGMYKQDIVTANVIAETQQKHNYPVLLGAAAGKNMPKRTIEIGNIVNFFKIGENSIPHNEYNCFINMNKNKGRVGMPVHAAVLIMSGKIY